ncbi:hypothetical protein [Paenibacillus foliorum]|nr:hypothetical protein [Paenibacillus foliorum]
MWAKVISILPDWEVWMQAFIAFIIPYGISSLFNRIRTSEKE